MRARATLTVLAAIAAISCATVPAPQAEDPAPASPASPSSRSAFVSPSIGLPFVTAAPASATASPAATSGEIRVLLEAGVFPANADAEALIVTRRLVDGKTTRVEAIDLKTRAVSAVHETVDAAVTVPSIRDGVVTLLETQDTDVPMQVRVRVLAGRWRDPSSFTVLDEFTIPVAGGDGWSPFPDPQTNGWEVVWMRTVAVGAYELRMRDADGTIHTIYSSSSAISFALARSGDVAIGDIALAGRTAPDALRLYSNGRVRTLLERPAGGGGFVSWQNGAVIWPMGVGLARYVTSVERIVPGTLERATITAPQGCLGYMGATEAQLAFACGDHVELTGGPGPARLGPPGPLLHARAMIRTEQGPPAIAYVTVVPSDDPRPGAGARF